MRRFALLVPLCLIMAATNANAWFFFFLPPSVTSKIGDALTGAEGDTCLPSSAKVGDTIPSASGNTAVVKSLSGTSSRCQDARYPIRALVTYNFSFSSKAGMNVPDGFEQTPLTDVQRFNGALLRAWHPYKKMTVYVSSSPRRPASDIASLARSVDANIIASTEDGKTSREEEIAVKGMRALRFEVEAKNKGLFGARFTYVVTVIEGAQELLVVNASAPTTREFEKERDELRQFALGIEGLGSADVPAPSTIASATPPMDSKQSAKVAPEAQAPVASSTTGAQPVPAVVAAPATPSAVVTAPTVPTSGQSVADRLRELEKLCKEGVLSASECELKRKELIKAL